MEIRGRREPPRPYALEAGVQQVGKRPGVGCLDLDARVRDDDRITVSVAELADTDHKVVSQVGDLSRVRGIVHDNAELVAFQRVHTGAGGAGHALFTAVDVGAGTVLLDVDNHVLVVLGATRGERTVEVEDDRVPGLVAERPGGSCGRRVPGTEAPEASSQASGTRLLSLLAKDSSTLPLSATSPW